MAGRVNLRRHSRIKKCRDQDKKDGRKHPVEDQKWCLWDSDGEKILYAGPTRKLVEKQERAVQYYKHNASFLVNDSVFRRSLIQAPEPGSLTKTRVAYSQEDIETKLLPWLSKLVKFAHALESTQEELLGLLQQKQEVVEKLHSDYPALIKSLDLKKLSSVADTYEEVGKDLISISSQLQKVFDHRTTYGSYLKELVPVIEMIEDEQVRSLFQEAAATLHIDKEAVL